MLLNILEKIGLSENSRNIYCWLVEHGQSSATRLSQGLSLPRATIYDNLKVLKSLDLITENEGETRKLFSVADPKNIQRLYESKIDELKQEQIKLKKILPKISQKTESLEPKIQFYAGSEGIKRVLKDLLWHENIETLTMWPISEMIPILGKEYLEDLNRRRIRRNISIRGIWPANKAVSLKEHPYLGVGKGHLRQLRKAPDKMTWDMSYWLYGDKVAFISSKNEAFGFVIHSRDFSNLIKAQFEVIWKLSKPIKPEPQYTDKFLSSI